MKPVIAIGALSGLAFSSHAASVNFTFDPSKTSLSVSESVTYTLSVSLDDAGLPSSPFGYYLQSVFINIINTGELDGTISEFDFTYGTTDLNGVGTPRALLAESTAAGDELFGVHWQVNNLNGDGVNDYIIGDIFETPFVLGTFTFHTVTPVPGVGPITPSVVDAFTVLPDQDFLDTQASVDSGANWASGTLGLADTVVPFDTWTVNGNPIPAPASGAGLALAGVLAARPRRTSQPGAHAPRL